MKMDEQSTFTCWKEIATYLGKGVRTVQRWERQFGLPVQRPSARCKGIVRASREELDHWMSTQWSRRASTDSKLDPALLRDRPTANNIQTLEEARARNRELLRQFKESLLALSSSCAELRETMLQQEKNEDRPSTAA